MDVQYKAVVMLKRFLAESQRIGSDEIYDINKVIGVLSKEPDNNKKGLIHGYKPNRLSLYILLINTGRIDELVKILYKDMEKYKLDEGKVEVNET